MRISEATEPRSNKGQTKILTGVFESRKHDWDIKGIELPGFDSKLDIRLWTSRQLT